MIRLSMDSKHAHDAAAIMDCSASSVATVLEPVADDACKEEEGRCVLSGPIRQAGKAGGTKRQTPPPKKGERAWAAQE